MNNHPVFDSAQELLRQGDTNQAIQVLIAFLEKDGTYPELLHSLRLVESNYNMARQQEIKGILAFSEAKREYAKSNDALLSILEDLRAGRRPPQGFSSTGDGRIKRPYLPWLIGGGFLLVLGLIIGIWVTWGQNHATVSEGARSADAVEKMNCPEFRENSHKVMILPFINEGGDSRQPEVVIQSRIRELTRDNKLSTDVKVSEVKQFEKSTPDIEDATNLGKKCGAELVIWGTYAQLKDSLSVDINYTFTKAEWPAGIARQTFANISEIKKVDGAAIFNLDEAVFRICTALALQDNRTDLVEKWLNKIKSPTPQEQEMKDKLKH